VPLFSPDSEPGIKKTSVAMSLVLCQPSIIG
jgi:hypothetical protein